MRDVCVTCYNLHDWMDFWNSDIIGAGPEMAVTLDLGLARVNYMESTSKNIEPKETNVDSGELENTMPPCKNCMKKERKIKDQENEYKDVLDTVDYLNNKITSYKSEIEYLRQQNKEVKQRSDEITSSMADILEKKGDLENVNDEFANTKLAKAFEALYDKKWTRLSEWLEDNNPKIDELIRIKFLTKLCKNAYEECFRFAEDQLRKFLFLDKNDKVPSPDADPTLYKIRRLHGQQPKTRNAIKKEVAAKVLGLVDTEVVLSTEENKEEIKKRLEEFLHEFIDCCWLMTISHPRLLLIFDVVDLPYSSVKERFKQYALQEEMVAKSKEKDSIYAVVWPSVVLEDGSGIFAKGDVVTVKIGKEY